MRVAVYYNLHRHLWSVKALEGQNKGRVIAHAKRLVLTDVKFKVNESGRQRVIRERVKNVHAFIIGNLTAIEDVAWLYLETGIVNGNWPDVSEADKCYITYNPYLFTGFVDRANGDLLAGLPWVVMDESRKVFSKKLV